MPLRICFISCQVLPHVGSENLWVDAAIRFAKEGATVSACVPWQWAKTALVESMEKSGVKIVFFHAERQLSQRILDRLDQVSGLTLPIKLLRSAHPVVFELRGLKGSINAFVLTQGGLYDSLTVNGLCESLCDAGVPYFLNVRSGRGYAGGADLAERALARRLFGQATGLIVPAKSNLNDVFCELAVQSEVNAVIHSPVKNRDSDSAPWRDGSTLRFACVSRYEAVEKGLDLLIQAIANLKDFPVPFEVSIYGAGQDEDYLRQLLDYFEIGGRVRLRGPYGSLGEVWAHNHVCLLPSRSEGMPQALMESMFAARPCVATPVGGVPDLVEDGSTGFLATAANAEAFSAALSRCLSAVAQLPDMGAKARQRAEKLLNRDPVGEFCAFVKGQLRV